ncbi:adenylate/guanylate cyclase domain-containing protein, partial [Sinorhizobium fredii]
MAEERVRRRLAAIVVADVVGYSRLMEEDEVTTLAVLKERRATILQPVVRAHGGRIVKVMGDGVLLEFASAVNALSGAIDLQRKMADKNAALPDARRIVLRIGINLGDVVIDGGDVYGDGVNIAARIQSLAEPGAIYVSAGIRDQVKRKLALGFDDLGPKSLKNIAEPVHVYRVLYEAAASMGHEGQAALPLPDKPSIAVLPFTNLSGEAEYDVFADGLTEDLITDLSRNAGLFVIARHSTFAYKGKSVDVRLIARELGVRYIVEGSARRAAGRVRVNVQLIDAVGGDHLWAERFDRNL